MTINETETPAPGTGRELEATPTGPSAETLTTDIPSGPTPETIPYSRFKEVNDRLIRLRGYESLTELGYDPDSLGQLVAFEQSYVQDEVGTLQRLVNNSSKLTEEQKSEMIAALEGNISPDEVERNLVTPSSEEEIPEWAKPIIEERTTRQQREEETKSNEFLDGIISKWNEADEADRLKPTPKSVQLAFIAANASHSTSVDQLIAVCRQMNKEYQTSILSDAVIPASEGLSGSVPRAVPSGGVLPSAPTPLKSLKDASAAARAAIEAGLLPVGRR